MAAREYPRSQPFGVLLGVSSSSFSLSSCLTFLSRSGSATGPLNGLSLLELLPFISLDDGQLCLGDGDLLKGLLSPLLLSVEVLVLDLFLLGLNLLEGGVVAGGEQGNSDKESNACGHLELVVNPVALIGGAAPSEDLVVGVLHAVAPGILSREVVIDSVELGVVVVDGDGDGPGDNQEGSADKVESSHEISSDVEEPNLSNVHVRHERHAPDHHDQTPGGPVEENANPLANAEDRLEGELGEE